MQINFIVRWTPISVFQYKNFGVRFAVFFALDVVNATLSGKKLTELRHDLPA
jgi:hypothetical protein